MAEFRIDTKSASVSRTWVGPASLNVEFPTLKDECQGVYCRYGFSGWLDYDLAKGPAVTKGFVKFDMKEKKEVCSVRW